MPSYTVVYFLLRLSAEFVEKPRCCNISREQISVYFQIVSSGGKKHSRTCLGFAGFIFVVFGS